MHRFVVCAQNHDQIGNRAMGERLHHEIAEEAWRAVSVVLLMVPMTPLLFMGQEWAASTPFQYFTDLEAGLGRLVTEGRRREFADFPAFADPAARGRIPDPQAEATFLNSRLRWDERSEGAHQRSLALYRALIALRLDHEALSGSEATTGCAASPDDDTAVVRRSDGRDTFWIVVRFRGGGDVNLEAAATALGTDPPGPLDPVRDTEHAEFAGGPTAIDVLGTRIHFERPGAIILRQR
jgi:maltooligosyltrehalose trehalohydrolase